MDELASYVRPEMITLFTAVLTAGANVVVTPVTQREGALRAAGLRGVLTCLGLLLVAPLLVSWEQILAVDAATFALFFLGVGPVLGAGAILYYMAVEEVGVARAFPVAFSHPLLTTLAGVFLLGERPSVWVLAGTAAIVAGIGLIGSSRTQTHRVPGKTEPLYRYRGFWYACLAALFWAGNVALMKVGLDRGTHPLLGNLLRMPGGVVLVALSLRVRKEKRSLWQITRRSWVALTASAFLGQVVGDVLYLWALQSSTLSGIVPLAATSPVWTAVLARLFLGESLNPRLVTGVLLAVVGVTAIVF